MGRKTKYTSQIVEKIVEVLRLTGSDRQAFEAARISHDTFYRWVKQYPDFSDALAQAKIDFRERCPEQLREKAMDALLDYLYGRVVETWTIHEIVRDREKIIHRESTKTVKRGVPQWVIERILGKPIDELEAVKCFVESGWLPYSVLKETTESLDEIRDRIRRAFQSEVPQN